MNTEQTGLLAVGELVVGDEGDVAHQGADVGRPARPNDPWGGIRGRGSQCRFACAKRHSRQLYPAPVIRTTPPGVRPQYGGLQRARGLRQIQFECRVSKGRKLCNQPPRRERQAKTFSRGRILRLNLMTICVACFSRQMRQSGV